MSSDIKLSDECIEVEGALLVKDLYFNPVLTISGSNANNLFYSLLFGYHQGLGKSILSCDAERFRIMNPTMPRKEAYSTIEHTSDDSLVINKGNSYSGGVKIEGDLTLSGDHIKINSLYGLEYLGPGSFFKIQGAPVYNNKAYQFVVGHWAGKYIMFCDAERFTIKNPALPNNGKTYSTIEHTSDDSLVINKGNSYSGGVKIEGDLALSGNINSKKPLKIGGVSFGYDDGSVPAIAANGGASIMHEKHELILTPNTIKIKIDTPGVMGHTNSVVKDLVEMVWTLRSEVDALKKKVGN